MSKAFKRKMKEKQEEDVLKMGMGNEINSDVNQKTNVFQITDYAIHQLDGNSDQSTDEVLKGGT